MIAARGTVRVKGQGQVRILPLLHLHFHACHSSVWSLYHFVPPLSVPLSSLSPCRYVGVGVRPNCSGCVSDTPAASMRRSGLLSPVPTTEAWEVTLFGSACLRLPPPTLLCIVHTWVLCQHKWNIFTRAAVFHNACYLFLWQQAKFKDLDSSFAKAVISQGVCLITTDSRKWVWLVWLGLGEPIRQVAE